MSRSIIQDGKYCYLGSSESTLDKHHIFNGALRKKSEKYGLWVYIGHYSHLNAHQKDTDILIDLKKIGQKAFEEKYGHEMFMREFHKNYLDDEDKEAFFDIGKDVFLS